MLGAKETTAGYLALDIRRLQREGLLTPGRWFGWQWLYRGEVTRLIYIRTETGRVVLSYRHRRRGSGWQDMEYPVRIDQTPCHFGGTRP